MVHVDSKDLEIILALQENPLASVSTIAKRVNMSISGTAIRLNKINENKETIIRVNSELNLKALELEIYDFFYKVDTKKSLDIIEKKVGYYHPYLSYRTRCIGKFSGVYMQFRSPKGSLNYHFDLSDELRKRNIISDYKLVKRNTVETSLVIKSALKFWDSKNQTWNFDWKTWRSGFDYISPTSISQSTNDKSILNELSDLDMKLLRELTVDARQKNIDFIRKLGMENENGIAQKVSRRLSFLKDHAISSFRTFLDYRVFDFYQTIVIHAKCTKNVARKLRNYLLIGIGKETKEIEYTSDVKLLAFPFQGVFVITEDGFQWYIRAPPSHMSEIVDFIWSICPQHDLFWTSYKDAFSYHFWDETFDSKNKKWKTDYDFMVKSVIDNL
jgi:DNA-binding Lrp family transcriptional regulator